MNRPADFSAGRRGHGGEGELRGREESGPECRGNPPFQPQVSVSNGSVDNPGGAGGAASLPFGMTAIDPVFKHPVAYMWSAGVQRDAPLGFVVDATYVGRKGRNLQRERNINQLQPGTVQANPGVNSAALRL